VDSAFNLRWCPSASCQKIIRFRNIPGSCGTIKFFQPTETGSNVACDCGTVFCSTCGEEGHQPLSCSLGAKWRNLIHGKYKDISEKWITLNTKKCPKCTVPIQKNDGCMHMVCESCHFEFCWLCLGEWSKHNTATGGFYKCNMYVPKDDPENTKIELDLQKYTFYSERYFEHLKSIEKAKVKRKIALEQFNKLCKCFGINQPSDFLQTALDGIIDSRRLLLYTFPMAYFANFTSTSAKDVFEFQQGELAYHLEKLDEITDHLQVRDTLKFRTKDDIYTFKNNVTDICRALGKYFSNMMEYFARSFSKMEEKYNEPDSAGSRRTNETKATDGMDIMDEIPEEMPQETIWNCPQCTFSNSADVHSCEKCQFNREGANNQQH
jgi:ariadne-1